MDLRIGSSRSGESGQRPDELDWQGKFPELQVRIILVNNNPPPLPLFCVSVESKGDEVACFDRVVQVLIPRELGEKGRNVQESESRGKTERNGGGTVGKERVGSQSSRPMLP